MKHFVMNKDNKDIIWLGIDCKGKKINSINDDFLRELGALLDDIALDDSIKGLVIYSEKETGFVAGVDIKFLLTMKDIDDLDPFLRKGHEVFSKIETLPFPTVAILDELCIGGGLEIALACNYAIASEQTKFSMPELFIGIHPGWGGTFRLFQTVGGFKALTQVLLPGKMLSANKMKQLGALNDITDSKNLKSLAMDYIFDKKPTLKPNIFARLQNTKPVRFTLAQMIKKRLSKQVNQDHYPAPFQLLDLWKDNGDDNINSTKEIESIRSIVQKNDTSKNLVRVFGLRERLRALGDGEDNRIKHVHIVGMGSKGIQVAFYLANSGIRVSISDNKTRALKEAMKAIEHLAWRYAAQDAKKILNRITMDIMDDHIKKADMLIDCAPDNLEAKKEVIQELKPLLRKKCIFATTSELYTSEVIHLAKQNHLTIMGVKFNYPLRTFGVAEIMIDRKYSKKALKKVFDFMDYISILPVQVDTVHGSLLNRIQIAYFLESIRLYEKVENATFVDNQARAFGMIKGPMEIIDAIGLDVIYHLARAHHHPIPKSLSMKVEQGHLGKKSNKGYFEYKNKRPIPQTIKVNENHQEAVTTNIDLLIKEAHECLQEGLVKDADTLDAAMIFGLGFPPFLGGPIHYFEQYSQDYKITTEKGVS